MLSYRSPLRFIETVYTGNVVPNIGKPLCDSSLVASSWRDVPVLGEYTVGDADDVGRDPAARLSPWPEKRPWTMTYSLSARITPFSYRKVGGALRFVNCLRHFKVLLVQAGT